MLLIVRALALLFLVGRYGVRSLECQYSSREYQVVLRHELLIRSFKTGVDRVLAELTRIEKSNELDFKVSISSLKWKNVSVTEYIPRADRTVNDFYLPLRFKSRQKKPYEAADIVLKTSNVDPSLACLTLKIADEYVETVSTKFELDVYAENGRIIAKTAHSFTVDPAMKYDQLASINIPKVFVDLSSQLTRSGQPLIVVPDPLGAVPMQTAEFDIRLGNEKVKATIFLLQRISGFQSEFSFKVKDETVGRQVLLASQQLIVELSRASAVAMFAVQSIRGQRFQKESVLRKLQK